MSMTDKMEKAAMTHQGRRTAQPRAASGDGNPAPFQITQRPEAEVPRPGHAGKVNEDLVALKDAMSKLASGMVLEIETRSPEAVRGTKVLITWAAKDLGEAWSHWNVGSTVYAARRPHQGNGRGRLRV